MGTVTIPLIEHTSDILTETTMILSCLIAAGVAFVGLIVAVCLDSARWPVRMPEPSKEPTAKEISDRIAGQ